MSALLLLLYKLGVKSTEIAMLHRALLVGVNNAGKSSDFFASPRTLEELLKALKVD